MSTTTDFNQGWDAGVAAANEFIGTHTLRQERNEVRRKRDAWNPARGATVNEFDDGYRQGYLARLVDHIHVTQAVLAGPPAR